MLFLMIGYIIEVRYTLVSKSEDHSLSVILCKWVIRLIQIQVLWTLMKFIDSYDPNSMSLPTHQLKGDFYSI